MSESISKLIKFSHYLADEARKVSLKYYKQKIDVVSKIEKGFDPVTVADIKIQKKLNKLLHISEKKTSRNTKLQINLALNYGSKLELINAFKNLSKKKEKINEKNLTKHLQTQNIPDPDLLIRTGNTQRLSNFLLWQLAYAEIFFEKKLWPEFNEKDYNRIIRHFKKIKRNFGNI